MKFDIINWKVAGFWPYAPMLGSSIEAGVELKGVTDWIDAKVPGSIYDDLKRAKIIPDPWYEDNSLLCEWVSNRCWYYASSFETPEIGRDAKVWLVFEGIDYRADIYLNGVHMATHQGMFIPLEIDVTDKLKGQGENQLFVLVDEAPKEVSQIGKTSEVRHLKSRFTYKWDFCTRLIGIGLYGKVFLNAVGQNRITDVQFKSEKPAAQGRANLRITADSFKDAETLIEITVTDGSQTVTKKTEIIHLQEGTNNLCLDLTVSHPRLWYPNGYGEQPLYQLNVRLCGDAGVSDEWTGQVGFCDREFVPNEENYPDALNYTLLHNGKKIYIKGVNMVPLDQCHGTIDFDRYDAFLKNVQNMNVNLIRVWGGGLIETEDFYTLCDRYGIMVWQEFIQSSSGLENVPSKSPEFMGELEKSAVCAIRQKRNHVSLTVWCGGNELTDNDRIPSSVADENIRMLAKLVEAYDEDRYFLPTSASGPSTSFSENQEKNHDIHGGWNYGGIVDHYTSFNRLSCLLHSEFGCAGMSGLDSLRKFLSEENLTPALMSDNKIWRHHGEWWDCVYRDREMFQKVQDLRDWIKLSQFIQAEGLRYAVESNRRQAFHNSGSIIWQMNEPWPNVACTSITDYYGVNKLAYYQVKEAYDSLHPSLRYDKLAWNQGEAFAADLYVTNDEEPSEVIVCWEAVTDQDVVLFTGKAVGNIGMGKSSQIGKLAFEIPGCKGFSIRMKVHTEKKAVESRVLFLIYDENNLCYVQPVLEYYDSYFPQ